MVYHSELTVSPTPQSPQDCFGKIAAIVHKRFDFTDFGSFDFIVVGGGTAGSVITNRLTENINWKVLLLEAGDLNDEYTDMPFVFDASGLSDRNWGYLTEPQRNGCYGMLKTYRNILNLIENFRKREETVSLSER